MMINAKLPLFLCILTASLTFAVEWHISLDNGNDSAAGTEQKPFRTLERALKASRLERIEDPSSSRSIVVHSGQYYFEKTIHLHPEDSGTKENPFIIKAAPGAKPRFIGGRSVGKWEKYEGSILKCNLLKQGINIKQPFTQLLFNGKRMSIARYPNFDPGNPYAGGFAYVAGEHISMYQECDSDHRNQFIAEKKDIHKWSRPEEMYISIFARYNWWNNIISLKSIDHDKSTITLAKNASYAIRPNDRYFFMNAQEELDAPGEWWYDRKTSDLYFYPPSPITSEQDVSIALASSIIKIIRATANVRLRGITFECCENSAINIYESTNCVIEKCVIRDTGFNRISGILISKGSDCGVFGCDISNTAWHGIEMNGGDRVTLTPTDHFAVNNNIHHTGASVKSGVGVRVDGVGCRIAHNWCHDMPRMGIQFSGNNHMIEYNRLHNLSLEIDDTTAIYTGGRNWLDSRGSTIRYNHITDVKGFGWDKEKGEYTSPHFSWGIYLDDNTGGVDVYGNIVEGSFSGSIHLHSSRDNHIYNNIFANSAQQQIQLSGWTSDGRWLRHLGQMVKGFESVEGRPEWKGMRNMQMHPTNSVLPDKTVMLGNRIVNNIIYYPGNTEAQYIKLRNFNFNANLIDSNILWAAGAPIITPYNTYANEKPGSSNIMQSASFARDNKTGKPLNWRWTSKPLPESRMTLIQDPDNKDNLCIQLFGSLDPKKGWDKFPGIISDDIILKAGSCYKLKARVKSDKVYKLDPLSLFSYKAHTYFWRTPNLPITLSTEWMEYTNTFKIPEKGEAKYNEAMTHFTPRIRFESADGWVMVDDITVVECQEPDQWKSWQMQGADQNSIMADPLFTDPKSGNFRLKPESPALKLKFKQIPAEKIGQYDHALRAR